MEKQMAMVLKLFLMGQSMMVSGMRASSNMAAVTTQMARSMRASGLMASPKDQELSHGQMGGSTMGNGTQASPQGSAGKFIQMAWPKRASGIMACLLKTVSDPI